MRALTRLWWLPALGAAAGLAAFDAGADAGDLAFFHDAALRLSTDGWLDVFSDPDLQVGPLQLALLAAGDAIAHVLGVGPLTFLAIATEIGAAALVLCVLGRLLEGRRERRGLILVGGLAAIALGLPHSAFVDGHPAQLVIPLLWILAGLEARNERTAAAGALVGLAGGLELWGLLGVAILALAPRLRGALMGLAATSAVVAVLFGPFVVAGEFRMFDYRWRVADGTLASLVLAPGTEFPWALRLAQGAAAVAAGAALAYALRRTPHAVWAGLVAVVAVRIAADPVLCSWYWLGLQILLLTGTATVVAFELAPRLRVTRLGRARDVPIHAP